ncbi:Rz1-like lysis system protein LysC [Candidimonas nitroreducens]
MILTGCTTCRLPSKPPTLPADLAAPCPRVPGFDSESWDDLGLAYIGLTTQYAQCAARHDAVVGAWPK